MVSILNLITCCICCQMALINVVRVTGTPLSIEMTSVQNALNALKTAVDEHQLIREFFHENIAKPGDINYCGKPSNCAELLCSGFKSSGVYNIYSKYEGNREEKIPVYCDMKTDGGGWIVFQKRDEYPEEQFNFTQDWDSYATGFGNLAKEFWLGNDNLHILTAQDRAILRIDLEDFEGNYRYAIYDDIEVDGREKYYKIKVGAYTGDAADGFSFTNNLTFVTYDHRDVNDCAKRFKGGWWYAGCHSSNLNGKYLNGKHESYADGVNWGTWLGNHYSLKKTEMKFRPKAFTSC